MSTPNNLLLLPLLQGLSRKELLQIAGRVRFNFRNFKREDVIVRQDEACRSLLIATSGEVCVTRHSDNGDYQLSEWYPAPLAIQPESLFGWRTHYTHGVVASTDVSLLEIDKDAVRDELFSYPAFRLGFLNHICYDAQRREGMLWRENGRSLPERLCHFLLQRCQRPSGRKELKIRKADLATHLGTSVRYVIPLLHTLQSKELVELMRGRLCIPSLEHLVAYVAATRQKP
ncbi:MAG: Crp/Fnr family transcriptional regulator [Alloprevotella sp.]|nr:Crp/Fnr family transcriptional regulator [Alloprevotella sp.]MBR1651998.1 Crp/Fnr family transcriptional regulator [Alloprevotella sp.]